MELNPAKRRKLVNPNEGAKPISRAGSFALEAEELVDALKVDWDRAFVGVDDLLHKVKALIEEIEGHEAVPVSQSPRSSANSDFSL